MPSVKITWNGPTVLKRERKAAARGLKKGMEFMLGETRKEVPIEEGTLERSGTASVDEDQLRGAISYDTPYAVEQHENLSFRHDEGRKAKYLEDPMNDSANRATVGKLVAAEIRRDLS